jgi:hypothetical protein
MHEALRLLGAYFWLLFIFGGAIVGWLAETLDVGVSALRRRKKAKRRHELALKRVELKIAQANAAAALPAADTRPKPGPCVHRDVRAVVNSVTDSTEAWLCKTCGEQLPANWAIRSEDL